MRLHDSSDTYLELIQATAAQSRIPAVHVEKDYWVTRVLKRLYESAYSEAVVLKGGTSLSKAHRLIFVDSDAFVELMAEVRKSDRKSMPGARAWLDPPLSAAAIVTDAENLWGEIRSEFRGNFKDMVYGDSLPNDAEVLECLAAIGSSLIKV